MVRVRGEECRVRVDPGEKHRAKKTPGAKHTWRKKHQAKYTPGEKSRRNKTGEKNRAKSTGRTTHGRNKMLPFAMLGTPGEPRQGLDIRLTA